jgi:hypothetical protein
LFGEELDVREATDSFTLSAEMNSSSALDNPAIARMIRSIVSRFHSAGAVVNPSSRLERYASLFDTDPPTDDASGQWALDSTLLETLQFVAISEAFGDDRLRQLAGDLSVAAAGSVDASNDRLDCKARSIQFELFLLSCLHASGLTVERREPDLVVRTSTAGSVAIAAKRLRSETKLAKNLRKGRSQVIRSQTSGLIAIDLTFTESIRKPVYVREARQHQVVSKVVVDQFVRDNEHVAMSALTGTPAVGVLFHFASVVRSLAPVARMISRRWLFLQTQPPPVNVATLEIMERLQAVGRPATSTD